MSAPSEATAPQGVSPPNTIPNGFLGNPISGNDPGAAPNPSRPLTAASFRDRRASVLSKGLEVAVFDTVPQHASPDPASETVRHVKDGRVDKRKRAASSGHAGATASAAKSKRRCSQASSSSSKKKGGSVRSDSIASVDSFANVTASARNYEDTIQASRLLTLPAELRLMILKFTVVTHKNITILGDTPKQPAISRTCRVLREDALRLFYKHNAFACTIINYDPRDFKAYRKIADKYGLSTVLLTHRHEPAAPRALLRDNLLEWLRGTYQGETAPLGYSSGHSDDTFVWDKLSHRIVKVFNQAKLLKNVNITWPIAREILTNAVDAAGVCGEKLK